MATPAPSRLPHLQPSDWIAAAMARLSREGIDLVCVEVLARDLHVSKGSFYWHFKDRDDLLVRLLERWETAEMEWLAGEEPQSAGPDRDSGNAAARWARFVARSAEPERMRTEFGIRTWARRDERVAQRLAHLETRTARVVAGILRDIGFAPDAADVWSQVVLLVRLGWIDRAIRGGEVQNSSLGLSDLLSELVLAASARAASENR